MVSDSCERHQSRITDIAFNPTADLIATCSNENKIELSSFRADLSKSGLNETVVLTLKWFILIQILVYLFFHEVGIAMKFSLFSSHFQCFALFQ